MCLFSNYSKMIIPRHCTHRVKYLTFSSSNYASSLCNIKNRVLFFVSFRAVVATDTYLSTVEAPRSRLSRQGDNSKGMSTVEKS